jgi:hypothetical protein
MDMLYWLIVIFHGAVGLRMIDGIRYATVIMVGPIFFSGENVMFSKTVIVAVCVASATWFAAPAIAQDPKRAAELVDKYFAPADRDVGGTVIDLHLMTGDWDFITLFPMSGGPADLTYTTSPDDVRWMTALGKRAGGMEAAKKLTDEWDTLVAKHEWHVGHTHNAPK